MKSIVISLLLFILSSNVFSQSDEIILLRDTDGMVLQINGNPFFIKGMNWDYYPRGTNYTYNLWNQSEEFIMNVLEREMPLLVDMGVNVIRQYTGVQRNWIKYIYEKYGIYTMLNHSFGRYGLTLDGKWVPNTEYSDHLTAELLLSEVTSLADEYKNTPGLLMYLLGNENNYGLFWEGAETEDIPLQDIRSSQRARAMYRLFNEAALAMKEIDSSYPIAICNGDLMFIEIIEEECKDIDVFGVNMYRGSSFGDAFEKVKELLNKPLMFTEFGADAYNVLKKEEDQKSQAFYLVENWREIYQNVKGMGDNGNSIGGFTFQFSDGWWKAGQTINLSEHDVSASWSNGGYESDYLEGENNMNEEWFGICAKGPTDERGLYNLRPRAAYYALKAVHELYPYEHDFGLERISNHFGKIDLKELTKGAERE